MHVFQTSSLFYSFLRRLKTKILFLLKNLAAFLFYVAKRKQRTCSQKMILSNLKFTNENFTEIWNRNYFYPVYPWCIISSGAPENLSKHSWTIEVLEELISEIFSAEWFNRLILNDLHISKRRKRYYFDKRSRNRRNKIDYSMIWNKKKIFRA